MGLWAWAYGHKSTWPYGHMGSLIGSQSSFLHIRGGESCICESQQYAYGHMGTWAHGHMGIWANVHMGRWAYGHMGTWPYGYRSIWPCRIVYLGVPIGIPFYRRPNGESIGM